MTRTPSLLRTLLCAAILVVLGGRLLSADALPTLYLIGDSTVNNGTKGQMGWGKALPAFFDTNRIAIVNRARGGRSSRTFLTEGLWDQVSAALKPGDFLLMQFGHNDGGSLRQNPSRASLKGVSDETQEVTDASTGKKETVHTYGWYLRQYIRDAKTKGATPIVLSPVPRNIWKDGKVARASGDYGKWAAEVAQSEGVLFVDLNELVARRYEEAGPEKVQSLYFGATDHTHTTAAGAEVNAAAVAAGLRESKPCALAAFLAPKPAPTLKRSAAGLFEIGVGISDRIPDRPADWRLLTTQFSYLTPENCMKPSPVQVAEGRFNFAQADAFVAFAASNQLSVCGHCLVWAKDDRTPPWFYRDGDKPASRELLLQRMKAHIDTVAGRYRGRIAMWDVVNEALDDGTNFLRSSGWLTIAGEGFIAKAFEYAHAADPQALLIYNDYNNELPAKREKLIRLVRLLREQNAPVHAIGLQGHYEIDRVPFKDIEATLARMKDLGVKVVVSELDIDVIPRGRWWTDGGKYRDELSKLDPYRDGCPPDILQRQAEQYAQLFHMFRKYADVIARVSFWNLHDGQSWLNGFPWRRVNHPLLFDRQGKPKPAFDAVVAVLTEKDASSP